MNESTESPLSLLREQTADLHDQVEALLGNRFFEGDSFTEEDYEALLGGFHRIYSPLEPTLEEALDQHLPRYEYVNRTRQLRDDLLTLGLSRQELSERYQNPESPPFALDSSARVLGCLYVIEGSEMGKKVIRRQLEKNLADEHLAADCFFHDNVDQTRDQWDQFQSSLESVVQTRREKQQLVQTAQDTFSWFKVGFT